MFNRIDLLGAEQPGTRLSPCCRPGCAVLHVSAFAARIGAAAMLRDDAFEAHTARCTKQIRPDPALLEMGNEDAVDGLQEKPVEVGPARRAGQPAVISPSPASTSKA